MSLELSIIDWQSPYYEQVLSLRNEVLRRPLGLNLNDEDLSEDRDQYIIIALNEDILVGCVMLKILDKETCKIRQMAVLQEFQARGIGTLLMHYAENFCSLNQYYNLELNARKTAIDFYSKLEYSIIVNEFLEVGMPHYKMFKKLEDRKE
jgi:predicted GNAT family N-acyltransferase